jgi:hypothetical protein
MRVRSIAGRLAARWASQGVARALDGWQAWSEFETARRRTLGKAVRRLGQQSTTKSLDAWISWAQAARGARTCVQRMRARSLQWQSMVCFAALRAHWQHGLRTVLAKLQARRDAAARNLFRATGTAWVSGIVLS